MLTATEGFLQILEIDLADILAVMTVTAANDNDP